MNEETGLGLSNAGVLRALGGPLAARAIADGAAAVEVVCGESPSWAEGPGARAQAAKLRRRALELAGLDEEAHARAIAVLRGREHLEPDRRDWEIGRAVAGAADPPLELAEVAADLTNLAAEVAGACDPDLRRTRWRPAWSRRARAGPRCTCWR